MSTFPHFQLFTLGGNNNNSNPAPPPPPSSSSFSLGTSSFKFGNPLQNLSNQQSLNNSCKASPITKPPPQQQQQNNNQTSAVQIPVVAPFSTTTKLPPVQQQQQVFSLPLSSNNNMNNNNNNNFSVGRTSGGMMMTMPTKSLAEIEAEERALANEELAIYQRLESIFSQNQAMDSEFLSLQNAWHDHYSLRSHAEREPAPDLSAEISAAEAELAAEKERYNFARAQHEGAQAQLGSLAELKRQLATCESELERLENEATSAIRQKKSLVAKCQRIADIEARRDHMLHRVGIILENDNLCPYPRNNNKSNNKQNKNQQHQSKQPSRQQSLVSSSSANIIHKKQQVPLLEDEQSEVFAVGDDGDFSGEEDEDEENEEQVVVPTNNNRGGRLSHHTTSSTARQQKSTKDLLGEASAILTIGNNTLKKSKHF
jgi:hypothetical protein